MEMGRRKVDDGPKLTRATPEDAKAVWEAIERRGETPTDGKVVDELVMSGRFYPVDRTTVLRWRKADWAPIRTKTKPDKGRSRAEQERLRAMAQNPEKYADMLGMAKENVEAILAKHVEHGDMNMMRAAARHCYANALVLSNMLQDRAANDPELGTVDAGKLAKAIADSVKSANQAMAILVNMGEELVRTVRMIEGHVVDNSGDPVADEDVRDDYGDVFAAFRLPVTVGGN